MRRLLAATTTSFALGLSAIHGAHAASPGDQLKQLRGTSRPIVILSDSRDDPRVAKQISALDRMKHELADRNIKI